MPLFDPPICGGGSGPLTCETDSVTICTEDALEVTGTIELGPITLSALETITVLQGTDPWIVGDGGGSLTVDAVDLDIRNLVFATDKVDVSGSTVALDAPTLAALETITVLQGTSPWVVSGTVALDAPTLAALETITVLQGTSPWVVSGAVALDAGTLAALETITVLQGTSPWVVSGNIAGTNRDDTDDQAAVSTGLVGSVNRNYVYDGTNWDRARSGGVIGMQGMAGAEAHDAPATGNPVLGAGRASNVLPAAVSADGDVARFWTTQNGRQRVYNSNRRRLGIYSITFSSTVTAAADGALVGRGWLVNNTGSTVFGALRRVSFTGTTTTGLLTPSAPIFTVERVTFTGTPSGAQITPCKRDSTDPANTLTWRSASTGMTLTAGAALTGFQMGGSLLATNMMTPMQYWPIFGDEDGYIVLRAGEGIVIRQSTAGTAADTRIGNFDVAWEEFNSTDFAVRD